MRIPRNMGTGEEPGPWWRLALVQGGGFTAWVRCHRGHAFSLSKAVIEADGRVHGPPGGLQSIACAAYPGRCDFHADPLWLDGWADAAVQIQGG